MAGNRELSYEEFNYATDKIDIWYKKGTRNLNVVTLPYNTTLIFRNIISKIINNGGKVLYVYSKREGTKELVNKLNTNIKCSYIESKDKNLTFINYKKIINLRCEYDLAIIDDVSVYCSIQNKYIENITDLINNVARKSIIYSIEDELNIDSKLKISSIYKIHPFVEPRIINTRVNLTEGMPYILYDYFKWFEKNKRKVIVYVPNEEKLKLLYRYYSKELDMKNSKFIFSYNKKITEVKEEVLKVQNKAIFIVTSNIEESIEELKIQDAVVLFADDSYYNYKKLIFLCANVENNINKVSEVLFVSKEISYDMDKVKNMAREFNKTLWEKKLINL